MAPFYGFGSTASRLEPLRGGSLLCTLAKTKHKNRAQKTYLSAIIFDVCDAPTIWYIHTAAQIQILYQAL